MDSKITVELHFFQEDCCASPDNKPVIEFFNYLIEHKFINSSKIIGDDFPEKFYKFYDTEDWIFECSIEQFWGFIKDFSSKTYGFDCTWEVECGICGNPNPYNECDCTHTYIHGIEDNTKMKISFGI